MLTVRVSALLEWQRCHRRYHLHTRTKIDGQSEATAKGNSFQAFVWAAMQGPREEAAALGEEMGGAAWGTEWRRAAKHLPATLWEGHWASEAPVYVQVGDVQVQGHIDRWRQTLDEILLLEIKTGKQSPGQYLIWNLQHRVYALGASEMYPGVPVWYSYLMPCKPMATPALFTPAQQRQTRREVEALVREWRADQDTGEGLWTPTYSPLCGYCAFEEVCRQVVMGAWTVEDGYATLEELTLQLSGPSSTQSLQEGASHVSE